MPAAPATTADIFCRVVDNFGDIGVCWRLARGLTDEHGWHVRLWVDDLHSFARLAPTLDVHADRQMLGAIDVVAWREAALSATSNAHDASRSSAPLKTTGANALAEPLTPRDVVIEAFACDPPTWFVMAMNAMSAPPVWINLEYLSAEDWIEGCHGLHSRRPDGLEKVFCFPGFTAKTGGLLRERDLLLARDRFQADAQAQDALLATCGVPADTRAHIAADGASVVTLFCYPDAPLHALFSALAQRDRPTVLIAPHGVAPHTESALAHLPPAQRARLVLCRIPFVPHDTFDRLLWLADLNVVRGEDSLVRALWAGRPLLWHIYPQDDAAHEVKLDAFLARTGWPDAAKVANRAFNKALPGDGASAEGTSTEGMSAEGTSIEGASADTASGAGTANPPAHTASIEAHALHAADAADTADAEDTVDAADFALLHDHSAFSTWQTAARRYADNVAAHRDLATTIADYGVRATE